MYRRYWYPAGGDGELLYPLVPPMVMMALARPFRVVVLCQAGEVGQVTVTGAILLAS